MVKYHISPTTGEPGICRANVRCPIGGDHFDNAREASNYAEKQLNDAFGSTTTFKKDGKTLTYNSFAPKELTLKEKIERDKKIVNDSIEGAPGLWKANDRVTSRDRISVRFKNGLSVGTLKNRSHEDLLKASASATALKNLQKAGVDGLSIKDVESLKHSINAGITTDPRKAAMLMDMITSSKDGNAKRAIIEKITDDTNDVLNRMEPGSTMAWKRKEKGDWQTPITHNRINHYMEKDAEAISHEAKQSEDNTVISYETLGKRFKTIKNIFKGKAA